MNLQEYQEFVGTVDLYDNHALLTHVLGLNGEAGEVADVVKKAYRDDEGAFTQDRLTSLQKELGDTLWYLTAICNDFGWDVEDILKMNVKKLESRRDRGVLTGSGDNR